MEPYNPKIILIVLRHYFCNLDNMSDSEALSYFFIFIEKVNENEDVDWNELPDYLIWRTYSETAPTDVAENMLNLYEDIKATLSINSQTCVVDKLELASELANSATEAHMATLGLRSFKSWNNGDVTYTDTAQDYFNHKFDYYYNIIINNSLHGHEDV